MASQESAPPSEIFARQVGSELMIQDELPLSLRPKRSASLPSWIAVIGNHVPRQCGIATFTTDLCDAIGAEFEAVHLMAVPVNDSGSHYG